MVLGNQRTILPTAGSGQTPDLDVVDDYRTAHIRNMGGADIDVLSWHLETVTERLVHIVYTSLSRIERPERLRALRYTNKRVVVRMRAHVVSWTGEVPLDRAADLYVDFIGFEHPSSVRTGDDLGEVGYLGFVVFFVIIRLCVIVVFRLRVRVTV